MYLGASRFKIYSDINKKSSIIILIILHPGARDEFLKLNNEIHFGIMYQDGFLNFRTKMHFGIFAPR